MPYETVFHRSHNFNPPTIYQQFTFVSRSFRSPFFSKTKCLIFFRVFVLSLWILAFLIPIKNLFNYFLETWAKGIRHERSPRTELGWFSELSLQPSATQLSNFFVLNSIFN